MIALILMGILMLSMIGAAMYSLVSMTEQTLSLTKAQSDKQSLDAAEAMIINRLKPIGINQQLIAPLGVAGENHQEIPADWGIKTSNSYGNKIVYCPIGSEIGALNNGFTNGNVKLSPTNDYPIRYTTDDKNAKYVAESTFIKDPSYENADVIAILISPKSGNDVTCSDIYLDNNKYRIKSESGSGYVKVITRDSVMSYQANQPVLISATENTSASFNDLANYWQGIQPLRYTIDLDIDGTKTVNANISFINNFPGNNKEIIIKGKSSEENSINASSTQTIVFDGLSVAIDKVSFNSNIKLIIKNSNVKIRNSELNGEFILINSVMASEATSFNNGISAHNSAWAMEGANSISNQGTLTGDVITSTLELVDTTISQEGNVSVSAGTSIPEAARLKNSIWSVNDGSASFTINNINSSALKIQNGSSLILDSSNVKVNSSNTNSHILIDIDETSKVSSRDSYFENLGSSTTFFNNSGAISFYNTDLLTPAAIVNAIRLTNSSTLLLEDGSEIGSPTNSVINGVVANGGSSVSGSSARIYAINCWSGTIFSFTGYQNEGSSFKGALDSEGIVDPSIHYDDIYQTINKSNWSCN